MIRHIVALSLIVSLIGCTSGPEPKKEPEKKPIGQLCKSILEANQSPLKEALDKKDWKKTTLIFRQYSQAGKDMSLKYFPKKDKENLGNYNKQSKGLEEAGLAGAKAASDKKIDLAKKHYRKIKQSCFRCHLAYR